MGREAMLGRVQAIETKTKKLLDSVGLKAVHKPGKPYMRRDRSLVSRIYDIEGAFKDIEKKIVKAHGAVPKRRTSTDKSMHGVVTALEGRVVELTIALNKVLVSKK